MKVLNFPSFFLLALIAAASTSRSANPFPSTTPFASPSSSSPSLFPWSGVAAIGLTSNEDLNATRNGIPLQQIWPRPSIMEEIGRGEGGLRFNGKTLEDKDVMYMDVDVEGVIGLEWDEWSRTFGGKVAEGQNEGGMMVKMGIRTGSGSTYSGPLLILTSPTVWRTKEMNNETIGQNDSTFSVDISSYLLTSIPSSQSSPAALSPLSSSTRPLQITYSVVPKEAGHWITFNNSSLILAGTRPPITNYSVVEVGFHASHPVTGAISHSWVVLKLQHQVSSPMPTSSSIPPPPQPTPNNSTRYGLIGFVGIAILGFAFLAVFKYAKDFRKLKKAKRAEGIRGLSSGESRGFSTALPDSSSNKSITSLKETVKPDIIIQGSFLTPRPLAGSQLPHPDHFHPTPTSHQELPEEDAGERVDMSFTLGEGRDREWDIASNGSVEGLGQKEGEVSSGIGCEQEERGEGEGQELAVDDTGFLHDSGSCPFQATESEPGDAAAGNSAQSMPTLIMEINSQIEFASGLITSGETGAIGVDDLGFLAENESAPGCLGRDDAVDGQGYADMIEPPALATPTLPVGGPSAPELRSIQRPRIFFLRPVENLEVPGESFSNAIHASDTAETLEPSRDDRFD